MWIGVSGGVMPRKYILAISINVRPPNMFLYSRMSIHYTALYLIYEDFTNKASLYKVTLHF